MKAVLSKRIGWTILILLVVFDAALDLLFTGGDGLQIGIWKPVAGALGVDNPLLLTPLVLVILYLAVKGAAMLTKKLDRVGVKAEQLVLTALVIIYGVFDLWLISLYLFGFRLFRSRFYLILILVIIGIAYGLFAERQIKKS